MSLKEIKRNFKVFDANREMLLKWRKGTYVVVVDEKIQNKRYESLKEAWEDSIKSHKIGTFNIQLVEEIGFC